MTLYMRDRQNREEGFEEGKQSQKIESITNALKKGRTIEDIADFMSCSIDEVQKIADEYLTVSAK